MTTSRTPHVAPSGSLTRPILVALAGLCLAGTLSADRIYRISEETIEDCTIVSENLTTVTYKGSNSKREENVPSESILRIEYDRKPALVGEGDSALEGEDLRLAADKYDEYLEKHLNERPERRYLWAPAYAANRLVEVHEILGDVDGTVAAANKLVENFPDSRYVPGAYMTMASTLAAAGKEAEAQKALDKLAKLIAEKGLSTRWELECRLAKVLHDSKRVGDARRSELRAVEKDAGGKFPTVRNRATVAIGESFLRDAGPQGDGGDGKALERARECFEDVIADPSADDQTLAGAYTGLGECLYQVAAASKEAEDAREALMAFMRVAVLYRGEVSYAPKAMFYAGRCFDLLGNDEDNIEQANKLYSRVIRNYPDSLWADQAKDFYRK